MCRKLRVTAQDPKHVLAQAPLRRYVVDCGREKRRRLVTQEERLCTVYLSGERWLKVVVCTRYRLTL